MLMSLVKEEKEEVPPRSAHLLLGWKCRIFYHQWKSVNKGFNFQPHHLLIKKDLLRRKCIPWGIIRLGGVQEKISTKVQNKKFHKFLCSKVGLFQMCHQRLVCLFIWNWNFRIQSSNISFLEISKFLSKMTSRASTVQILKFMKFYHSKQ